MLLLQYPELIMMQTLQLSLNIVVDFPYEYLCLPEKEDRQPQENKSLSAMYFIFQCFFGRVYEVKGRE